MSARWGFVAAVAATLLVALWVTAGSTPVQIIEGGEGAPASENQQQLERRSTSGDDTAPPPAQEDQDFAAWLETASTIIAILFLVAVIGWVMWVGLGAFQRRRRRRRRRSFETEPERPLQDAFLDNAHRELSFAADEQIDALRLGEPRNAIVACWVALEDAVERAGVPRDPAETSTEFTERIIAAVTVDRGEFAALGSLYREARFSTHALEERHRDDALELLTSLGDDLRRRRPAASEVPASLTSAPSTSASNSRRSV